ncbi:unnamed protein product, partial [Oppiella nova]
IFDGNKPVLTVADPALVKQILVKDFDVFADRYQTPGPHPITGDEHLGEAHGADWRRMHAVWSAMFTGAKLRHLYPTLTDCVHELVRTLDATGDAPIDLVPIFEKFAMDALVSTGFSVKCGAQCDPGASNAFMRNYSMAFNTDYVRGRTLQAVWKWMLEMVGVVHVKTQPFNVFYMDFVRRVLADRERHSSGRYSDFIQSFIKSERDTSLGTMASDATNGLRLLCLTESLSSYISVTKSGLPTRSTGKYLTKGEVASNGWLLFISGTETITTTLSFVAYELARNPDVQRRLRDEIVAASVDTNGSVGYEALTRLPYLDAVLSETLRLHAPFHRVIRTATRDYTLPGAGIGIKMGQKVEVPVYAIHHHEGYYTNTEHFYPDRFLTDRKPTMYMPFGIGPRNCVAGRFAMLELKIAVTHIIKRFTLEVVGKPDAPVPLMNRQEVHKPSSIVLRLALSSNGTRDRGGTDVLLKSTNFCHKNLTN